MHWYEADVALPRTVVLGESREPEIELYPIQIDLYRHTQPPKGAFNMGSLGINNIMSQIYGNISGTGSSTSNNETSSGGGTSADQQAAVATPKRTLQYRASFSRKNTVRQIMDFLAQRLKIVVDDLRLWVMEEAIEMELLEEDARVSCLHPILISNLYLNKSPKNKKLFFKSRLNFWPILRKFDP